MGKRVFRILSLLLSLTLLIGSVAVSAGAVTVPLRVIHSGSYSYVDPMYQGDLALPEPPPEKTGLSVCSLGDYLSWEEAVEYLRGEMVRRDTGISFDFVVEGFDDDFCNALFLDAIAHTGNPLEGDYLWRQIGRWRADYSYYYSGNTYYISVTFTVTYHDSAEHQPMVDDAVDALLSELALDGKSDYEKVCAVYDWMTANIAYDFEHLEDESYSLKWTAYGALVDRTSVCQGYAVLFYRLMLTLGIDCRIIFGYANGRHSWNIVRLDGLYYNVDATWDAGRGPYYDYFLISQDRMNLDHMRDADFDSDEFHSEYPMSDVNYSEADHKEPVEPDPGVTEPEENEPETPDTGIIAGGVCGEDLTWTLTEEGVLTVSGIGDMTEYEWAATPWYEYRSFVTELVLEEGVTSTSSYSFCDLVALEQISLPGTLTRIGNFSFLNCPKLCDFTLPDGLEAIGQQAFDGCSSITSFVVPSSVTFLDVGVCNNCTSLTSVYFEGNSPSCSYMMGMGQFVGCRNLESIQVGEGHSALSSRDGVLFLGTDLICYPAGKSGTTFIVPEGTVNIWNRAFMGSEYLEKITIPGSVEYIGFQAFGEAANLKEIYFCGDAPDFDEDSMLWFYGTCYYPRGNTTWSMATIPGSVSLEACCPICFSAEETVCVENYTAPTGRNEGSYDEVIRCAGCGEFISSTHYTIPATGEEKDVALGDVNGDGWCDAEDAALIMQYEVGLVAGLDESVADVNGDGWCDAEDAALIMQYEVGLITQF